MTFTIDVRYHPRVVSASKHRASIRLKDYDYAQAGAYFVTACVRDRRCLCGEIADDVMRMNEYGRIVESCWNESPQHFPHVELDAFVVMPNHVHGIVVITGAVGARHASSLPHPTRAHGTDKGSLGVIVGSFKSAVTKRINDLHGSRGAIVWQRNYYERVSRDEREPYCARQYILDNPLLCALDRENPLNITP